MKDNRKSTFSLEVFIEGWRYWNGESVFETLKIGDYLKLERELENPKDKYAVKILTQNDDHLGYIPAVYSEFFSNVLGSNNNYTVQITKLNPEAIPQMKVHVSIQGTCKFDQESSDRSDKNFKRDDELVLL